MTRLPRRESLVTTGAEEGRGRLHRIELGAGLLATLLLVGVHVTVLRHAGALWRDEINTVNLATMPSLAAMWSMSDQDSFPILWFFVVRGWAALGGAGSDVGLRTLGLVVGIATLVALWWVARQLGAGVPLASLLLFAASPTVFHVGDSLRAYGVGVLLMLVTLGALWRALREPTPARLVLAGAAALASVQALYYNAILLLALCAGGLAMGLRRREWRAVRGVTLIGLVAAGSLLPYLRTMARRRAWDVLARGSVELSDLAANFVDAVRPAGAPTLWIWLALFALSVGVLSRRAVLGGGRPPEESRDLALFLGGALVVGTVSYVAFLRLLGYPTKPWYYVALMALLAVVFDAALDALVAARAHARLARLGGFVALALLASTSVWREAHVRYTNVDLVAARLGALAAKDDLIVVNPWWLGVSFMRYYGGPAPWVTLPDIGDHRLVRYDLVKQKMAERAPIEPVLGRLHATLASGHRVWVVGTLLFPAPGEAPGDLPPAPEGLQGWRPLPYLVVWSRQAAALVRSHGAGIADVPVSAADPVSFYERVPLSVVSPRAAASE